MTSCPHQGGAWIMIFINAVTKAHQSERIVFILGLIYISGDMFNIINFYQHVEYGFIGTTVGCTPETGNPGSNTNVWIGTAGTGQADG